MYRKYKTRKMSIRHSKTRLKWVEFLTFKVQKNIMLLSFLLRLPSEHIELWSSAVKCRFCTSTVVQAQLRFKPRNNRLFEEGLEESSCCQSRANDAFASLGCFLSKCWRTLLKTGAVENVSLKAQKHGRRREENFKIEKIFGYERAATSGNRTNDAARETT